MKASGLGRLAGATAGVLLGAHVAWCVADAACPLPEAARQRPRSSPVVTAGDGTALRVGLTEEGARRLPLSRDDLPPVLVRALLLAEDRRFFEHGGVDARALTRAALRCLSRGGPVEGGSTLTMQWARMVDPAPRTVRGKARQIFRAWQLERRWCKDEILVRYLEDVPMPGNLRGVAAASAALFGKAVRDLSADEAALLVALLPAPGRLDPRRRPEAARARRDAILDALRDEGTISAPAHAAARARPVEVASGFPSPAVAATLRVGAGRSSIDADAQRAVAALVAEAPPPDGVAVVVTDVATARVRVAVGAREDRADLLDAVSRPRAAGSTLKPFLFALALDRGLVAPRTPLLDLPWAGADGAPANFDGRFSGPRPAADALASSLNVPAVRLVAALPRGAFSAHLVRCGLVRVRSPDLPGTDVALGADDVTPLELAEAATAIAAGGWHRPLDWRLDGDARPGTRVMSPGACALVTGALSGALSGTLRERPPGAPREGIAWKTGTSSHRRDAWAVGWTRQVVVVVWRGRLDGGPDDTLVGARAAVPLLFDVLARVDPRPAPFPPLPTDPAVEEVEVCAASGLAPGLACDARLRDARPVGAAPLVGCPVHVRVALDAATGALRCASCARGASLRLRDLAVFPAAWAAHRREVGLPVDELPSHAPDCPEPLEPPHAGPRVVMPRPGTTVRARADGGASVVLLAATSTRGPLRVVVDGREARVPLGSAPVALDLGVGRHAIVVLDEAGRAAATEVEVVAGP